MQKIKLSETIIVYDFIPKIAKIDRLSIAKTIHKNKVTNDIFDVRHLYHKVDWTQSVQWFDSYVVDHFGESDGYALYMLEKNSYFAINQPKNTSIDWHTWFNPNDIKSSPDWVCIYPLTDIEEKPELMVEYTDNRIKLNYWKLPIESNKFIMFNGDLRFKITNNNNDNDINYLVMKYQSK
tara:strand:+ start:1482 stop:2021 length:540 start_codon:yes stop_codon:yes gene_type:complete